MAEQLFIVLLMVKRGKVVPGAEDLISKIPFVGKSPKVTGWLGAAFILAL